MSWKMHSVTVGSHFSPKPICWIAALVTARFRKAPDASNDFIWALIFLRFPFALLVLVYQLIFSSTVFIIIPTNVLWLIINCSCGNQFRFFWLLAGSFRLHVAHTYRIALLPYFRRCAISLSDHHGASGGRNDRRKKPLVVLRCLLVWLSVGVGKRGFAELPPFRIYSSAQWSELEKKNHAKNYAFK